jgi:hypothetical protein
MSRVNRTPRTVSSSRRCKGPLYGSQLAFDGLQVEVLVDAVDLTVRNMEHKAAQELVVLARGSERDRGKVRLVSQRTSRAVF